MEDMPSAVHRSSERRVDRELRSRVLWPPPCTRGENRQTRRRAARHPSPWRLSTFDLAARWWMTVAACPTRSSSKRRWRLRQATQRLFSKSPTHAYCPITRRLGEYRSEVLCGVSRSLRRVCSAWAPLELMLSFVFERDAGSGDQVLQSAGDQHLARRREGSDTSGDVDGEPGEVAASDFALTAVQPGAYFSADGSSRLGDRLRAADCPGRSIEGRAETVAGCVDLASVERRSSARTTRSWASCHSNQ